MQPKIVVIAESRTCRPDTEVRYLNEKNDDVSLDYEVIELSQSQSD
jgi:hypothetical protein